MKSDNESHHESVSLNISAFSNSHFCRAAWEKGFAALEEGRRDEKKKTFTEEGKAVILSKLVWRP